MNKYDGVEGFIPELGATVRECIDCGCLVAGGPTRCVRCAKEGALQHRVHWTRASIGSKLLACVWLLPVTRAVSPPNCYERRFHEWKIDYSHRCVCFVYCIRIPRLGVVRVEASYCDCLGAYVRRG